MSYEIAKRCFDFALAAVLTVVLSPIMALIAIAIARDSAGPLLYRGTRVAKGGGEFSMLKFRTMVANAEAIGGASTAGDDSRITKVGAFLRSCKLDELPQLFNILRGEMSFVGPRPNVAFDVALYTPEERVILDVLPGITDYASIHYSNEGEILHGEADPDEAFNRLIRPGKIYLQLRYVRERSLWVDLKCIGLTAYAIFAQIVGLPRVQFPIPREVWESAGEKPKQGQVVNA